MAFVEFGASAIGAVLAVGVGAAAVGGVEGAYLAVGVTFGDDGGGSVGGGKGESYGGERQEEQDWEVHGEIQGSNAVYMELARFSELEWDSGEATGFETVWDRIK